MAHIFTEILDWSKGLAPWQNEAIRRLFGKASLSADDRDAIFGHAKAEHGLEPQPVPPPDLMLKSAELPAPPVDGAKIYLKGLRELVNVNALRSDQRLAVGKQLTGIYGDNGVGKSGYARVTKRACRARAVDPILPNVYADGTAQPPTATFEVEENDVARDEKWVEGQAPPECLGRFAVFDSKCARLYVSDNNELGFLPYGFDIIKGLAAITDEVKRRFQELGKAPDPNILKPFLDGTDVGIQLKTLSDKTDENTIKVLGEWNQALAAELSAKETELAGLKAKSPQAIRDALNAEKKRLQLVIASVESSLAPVSEQKVLEIKGKVEEFHKFEQAVSAAAEMAFGGMNLPGIGGKAWRELILSAAAFSTEEAYPEQPFPAPAADAKCVLCLRPLDGESRNRLTQFWNFIKDDTSKKRDSAKAAADAEVSALKSVPSDVPKEIAVIKDALDAAGSKVYALLPQFYESIGKRRKDIEGAVAGKPWESIAPLPASPVAEATSEVEAIDKRLAEVQDDKKIADLITALEKGIANLKARQQLNTHLQTVLNYLKSLKAATAASRAAGKITTNGISLKSAELQNKFVTEEFIKAVNAELGKFGLPRVKPKLDKKTEKGKVLLKFNVQAGKSVPIESVFSEGERTAISLACFFAELAVSKDNCGIILDDPVSSLSHRIRERVVDRLVVEAGKRQVIVFTHDLIFHRELRAACKRHNVDYAFQYINALGSTIGIIDDNAPWAAMKVKDRLKEIEQMLKAVGAAESKGDADAYIRLFREFYGALRSTWERSVEEILFNQVIQRLEKDVQTRRLDGVHVDSDSVKAIYDGMSRTSAMIDAHDHAVAENKPLPSVKEVEMDLAAFKDFIMAQTKKREKAEQDNKHLK